MGSRVSGLLRALGSGFVGPERVSGVVCDRCWGWFERRGRNEGFAELVLVLVGLCCPYVVQEGCCAALNCACRCCVREIGKLGLVCASARLLRRSGAGEGVGVRSRLGGAVLQSMFSLAVPLHHDAGSVLCVILLGSHACRADVLQLYVGSGVVRGFCVRAKLVQCNGNVNVLRK